MNGNARVAGPPVPSAPAGPRSPRAVRAGAPLTGRRLVGLLLRHRRRQAATLFALTAVVVGAASVAASLGANVERAVVDGARAEVAGYPYVLQPQTAEASMAASQVEGAVAVVISSGEVSAGELTVPATVRQYDVAGAHQGVLVEGRAPDADGEALLSRAVADVLGAALAGQTVDLAFSDGAAQTVTVTGVVVDPADRTAAIVDVLDVGIDPAQATTWLVPQRPFDDPALAEAFATVAIEGRAVDPRASGVVGTTVVASLVSGAGVGSWALVAGAAILAAALLTSFARTCRGTVEGLQSAGLSRPRAWGLMVRAGQRMVVAAAAFGAAVGCGGVLILTEPLSATVGQYWVGRAVPWAALVGFVAVMAVLPITVTTLAVRRTDRLLVPSGGGLPVLDPRWATAALAAATAAAAANLTGRPTVHLMLATGFLLVMGSYGLMAYAVRRGQSPAVDVVLRASARELAVVCAVATTLALLGGTQATFDLANSVVARDTYVASQPAGTLAANRVNATARQRVSTQFHEFSGGQVRWFALPDESATVWRAANPGLIRCIEEQPTADPFMLQRSCGPSNDSRVPINVVALSGSPLPGDSPVAFAALLAEDDRIGLIELDAGTPTVLRATVHQGTVDHDLGENLPGAVVRTDSDLAAQLGLRPSGAELMVLYGFTDLDEVDQAAVRHTLRQLAPGAEIAVAEEFTDDGFAAYATAVALAVGAVVCLLLALGGSAYATSRTDLRSALVELGVRRRHRTALALRIAAPTGAAAIAVLVATAVTVWVMGHHAFLPNWIWTVPGLAALAAASAVVFAFRKPPAEAGR